jgi:hypothetical protein
MTEALDLAQPAHQLVPTRENLAHFLSSLDGASFRSPFRCALGRRPSLAAAGALSSLTLLFSAAMLSESLKDLSL